MFTFIHTSVLIGLAGVTIPILIHLFARRKVRTVHFSSVAFLRKIHAQRMRRIKLRQILLLVLRCLALLFFILAFARPTIRYAGRAEKGGACSSVLLVDRSMSMGSGDLFSRTRERALAFLAAMGREDEAALVWVGGEATGGLSFTRDPGVMERKLSEAGVSQRRGRVREALREAKDLLASSNNLNREIFLIGDLQATGFEGVSDSAFAGWEGNAYFLPAERSVENVGIVDCGISNRIRQPGVPLDVYATVRNFGLRAVGNLLVRHSLNGIAVAQEEIGLEAGEERRVSFRVLPEDTGWIHGSFRLDEDGLPADDVRFFSAWIPERIRVLLVGDGRGDILPFQKCLQAYGGGVTFEAQTALEGEEWIGRLRETEVVVLSNPPSFRQDEGEALLRFVQEGGGVFLWMGDAVELRSLHRQFLSRIDLVLENLRGGSGGGYFSFESVDYGHPLFQGVFEEGRASVHSPRFFKIIDAIGGAGGRIGTLTGGHPWLVERQSGKGRVLVATTGIDEAWSDLAYTTFFAPLTTRALVYLASPEAGEDACLAGDALLWERRAESVSADYRVEDPMGESIRVLPGMSGDRMMLRVDHAELPGIYKLYLEGDLLGLRAVNVDPGESDLRPISENEAAAFFPAARTAFVEETEGLGRVMERNRWGRELWAEMLLLGLAALIAEMAVARAGRRD